MYLMTKCGNSGIKPVDNYKNKDSLITRGRQNPDICPSCNNLWVFKWDIVMLDE